VRGASFARHANITIVDQIGDLGEEYHDVCRRRRARTDLQDVRISLLSLAEC
jgi:hypothetical protein